MHRNTKTRDITIQFQHAARQLNAGKLIKDDHFSLFEAVGALEIGDPKMDSGCLGPGESLEDEFDVEKGILPQELIWLMDQMLNREVAWLMGYPLSQTLFTSVHIDRLLWPNPVKLDHVAFSPGRDSERSCLPHKILRAYSVLLVKACDFVLTMVTSQHYYEEEDFTTQLFNRELLHRFSGEDVRAIGTEAVQVLGESTIDEEFKRALRARLDFRIGVLELFMQQSDGKRPPDSLYRALQQNVRDQQKSERLGQVVEAAFSTKLQRRLASTVPPRPMVTVSMDQAWSFWNQMLGDCKDVFTAQVAKHSQDLFTAYQLLACGEPQPSTFPRALLQSFLTSNDGFVTGRVDTLRFMEEDLRSLTLPASPLLSISANRYGRLYNGNPRVAECMQDFVDKFEHTFINLYRASCLNNCRMRRTFCHALLEWDSKQGEIEDIDTIVQLELGGQALQDSPDRQSDLAFPLSSWVYHHKLTLHRLTIQMGFEQMIYASHELAGMYQYLSSISNVHLGHLERISHFVTNRDADIKSSSMEASTKTEAITECKEALDRLFRQFAWIKATQLLASTLQIIFVVLQRNGVFVASAPLYSSSDLRYEIRMKPFLGLSVPAIQAPEDHARETQVQHLSTETILERASELGNAAKKAWEELAKTTWHALPLAQEPSTVAGKDDGKVLQERWTTDVRNCLKASIAAGLCVLTLRKMHNHPQWWVKARRETTIARAGEKGRWHRWWVVPSVPSA